MVNVRKNPGNYKSCVDRRNHKWDGKRISSIWSMNYAGRTSWHHTFIQMRLRESMKKRIQWNIDMQTIRFK